jgi:penicillin amidase
MVDAQVLTPSILQAFTSAQRSGAPASLAVFASDPAVSEAVGRLGNWDFTTPTGIDTGFDTISYDGQLKGKSEKKSVAATIYSAWRGQIIKNTIDGTLVRLRLEVTPGGERAMGALRNLLDNFATNRGRGASGVNFFDVPNLNLAPEVERDIIILQSLKDALTLLASPAFAPAFGESRNQKDYRWGKLHRIVFAHVLNLPPVNIPFGGVGFTDLGPGLPGLATDGGFDTVDAATHSARASTVNGFMYNGGPSRRFVGEARPKKMRAVQNIPGGESGIPGTPFFGNLLRTFLVNVYHDALTADDKVDRNAVFRQVFEPAK